MGKRARASPRVGSIKLSLAIAATLSPTTATLTDKDIDAVAARIVDGVTKATGGVIRG